MKTLLKVFFVFAALFIIENSNTVQAQQDSSTELWITNPTCCPAAGTCGADHPDLGPANPQPFYGHGLFREFIGWNTFLPPGTAIVTYWARTGTVEVGNAAYDAMYCYGENDVEIGYNYNLVATVTTSPVYIYYPEDPE